MRCNGIVIGFNLSPGESLKPLMQLGYAKPVKDEQGHITSEKRGYEHSVFVELERINDQAFFTVHPNYNAEEQAVGELLDDLRKIGSVS